MFVYLQRVVYVSLLSINKCVSVFLNPSLYGTSLWREKGYQHLSILIDFLFAVLGVFPVYEVYMAPLLELVWGEAVPCLLSPLLS